ncbi:post-GPI attachment to proteins factor 4-like [Branchiostoma floridae]|uniref:Post-GPI attachment to proteins factor 4-like n=1 Tax=Branchiostoma floridae TaxID=7739 RepID=A0A9J7KW48_BRAFL|nr:post-GPI attachment to proteins factor 4-like [Branchiostoma floridae]XP_035670865.1 post-GPI attachment to proteins factor 4-like [Branchiostoma floridae]XP_035670866.1 post-GPI attachment to proteins factor 4-like [Branchiostoma floridae]XP_035670867.1 post-GPI attachment to proteins factor 4-like [Branchiostoma floridae]XP_035670868.1 post-GPI attachment to proteins factor 4-like [Branchiostoma floridae]
MMQGCTIFRRPVCDVLILYIGMFCVVLPILCHRLHYSIYYSQTLHMGKTDSFAYAMKVNDDRKNLAQISLLSRSSATSHLMPNADSKVKLAIGFVSVSRQVKMRDGSLYNPGYLLQSVEAILRENPSNETRLVVCNVDSDPSSNVDAAFLSSFVPVHSRYLERNVVSPLGLKERFKKEREDYIYCLEEALSFDPEFVLILEDDALAIPGVLDVIYHVIQTKIDKKYRGFELTENNYTKTFFKLFTPTYMQNDFHTTKPKRIFVHIYELIGIGIIGGTIITFVHTLFFNKGLKRSYATIYGLFVAGVVCSILAALAVSRVHLMEWRRISKHFYVMFQADNCCTPAIMYRKDTAVDFLRYLQTRRHDDSPIDGDMNGLVVSHGYRRFAVEPNLFSHIGMFSSIQKKINRGFLHGFV